MFGVKMQQLTLFEVQADLIIADLEKTMEEIGLNREQKKAAYLQILFRLLAENLHRNTAANTALNLLQDYAR
jgi:hypothetical protein